MSNPDYPFGEDFAKGVTDQGWCVHHIRKLYEELEKLNEYVARLDAATVKLVELPRMENKRNET